MNPDTTIAVTGFSGKALLWLQQNWLLVLLIAVILFLLIFSVFIPMYRKLKMKKENKDEKQA